VKLNRSFPLDQSTPMLLTVVMHTDTAHRDYIYIL
jgi:hypothetical protein